MKIAVVGAGMCGLAASWYLASQSANVTLFDPKGIGHGASGVAAGLLHGYVGAHAKHNWRANEGLSATLDLMKVAEGALGESVFSQSGILRPALNPQQVEDFTLCASRYKDVKWKSAEQCQREVTGIVNCPGLFIESGCEVNCPLYLKGLWLACQRTGNVQLEEVQIKSLSQLSSFDYIVIAMGADIINIKEINHLQFTFIKGQILELKWPSHLPPLPYAINSQAYLLMSPSGETCIAGSTYERKYTNENPDLKTAIADILPKINAFLNLSEASIIDCRAGIRAIAINRRPVMSQVNSNCWVLGGMGSKGLLYHALCAKTVTAGILAIK